MNSVKELPVEIAPELSPHEPDHARRFGGVARIYGALALERFTQARVAVVGVGGVGSWAVEALARSAVGYLCLIDLDQISESNMNRQLQALGATVGQAKVIALAQRIADINPDCEVRCVEEFIDPENVGTLIPAGSFDYVIDAIDDGRAKVALAVHCQALGIPLIVVGSAGGQTDPTRVRVSDLAHTEHDPLLARVRKRLRTEHGFSRNIKARFGIEAVFSDEPLIAPAGQSDAAAPVGLNCAGYGSSVAVTAVFGFVAAGRVLSALARSQVGLQAMP